MKRAGHPCPPLLLALLLALLLGGTFLLEIAGAAENHPPRKPASEHPVPAPTHVPPPGPAAAPARPVSAAPVPSTVSAPLAQSRASAPLTAVVMGCRLDAHPFRGLAAGFVDYCRGHLGYAPGAPDCYAFAEEVCTVFLPANDTWTETRRVLAADVFPCPDAPEPPVCPRLTWR